MYDVEVLPQKVVEPKIVVLKTRLDSNMVRLQVEGLKQNFFTKLGFLKPKAKEIILISSEKYYEPYIVIGGKYSLDYCRKHTFNLEVKNQTHEVFIAGQKFEVLTSKSGKKLKQVIKLEGEDYAHYEKESFFVLDRLRREISPESFSFAPYDMQLKGASDLDLNLRKVRISVNEIIELVRSRIAKRPPDLAEIIKEFFEITENTIVYRPFFEFTFHNKKANKFATLRVDGVSGEQFVYKFENDNSRMFLSNSNMETGLNSEKIRKNAFSEGSTRSNSKNTSKIPEPNIIDTAKQSAKKSQILSTSDEIVALKFPAYVTGEIFLVGDNLTAVVGDLKIPSGTTVNDALVVKGKLTIGDNCRLFRKVKVLGDVLVGIDTVIDGDVVSGGNVVIGSSSVVGGCVKASGRVEINENVIVGKKLKEKLDLPKDSFDLQTILNSTKEEVSV
jgi:carbonic anhydrase/acetyltransferase-like protein (isoleucine patch superfamily)